ncbi:MAG: helix-turn-helix domain-containing protein [Gammaproteobacteria bacterium]|nr:helix-turn-helix domain-containing protein [Gammaproteobacteria bacterium]
MSIEIMLANIERPRSIETICDSVGWPRWRLRRLFQRHLSMSPQAYYLELRLDRARNLLRNSSEQVGTIALMCGFPATESLSRTYKSRFGISPGRDRQL